MVDHRVMQYKAMSYIVSNHRRSIMDVLSKIECLLTLCISSIYLLISPVSRVCAVSRVSRTIILEHPEHTRASWRRVSHSQVLLHPMCDPRRDKKTSRVRYAVIDLLIYEDNAEMTRVHQECR
eukprot:313730-Amorphochlora_amoeboformis.AAC.1